MAIIDSVRIKGLKSINEIGFDCGALNLFVGVNSSGKSTILQSILLLAQSNHENHTLVLNGPLLTMGGHDEVESTFMDGHDIEIQAVIKCQDVSVVSKKADDDNLRQYDSLNDMQVYYVPALHVAGVDLYSVDYSSKYKFGPHSEYAISYLSKNKYADIVDYSLVFKKQRLPGNLLEMINFWMEYIVGAHMRAENVQDTDYVKTKYAVGGENYRRARHVGSGVSFLLNLLIVCLSAEKGAVIVIENPELHLHPKAQSRLIEFLYYISANDRQLFIETHSDHLFNGIRAGIATGNFDSSTIFVNFIALEDQGSILTKIDIDENGRIENPKTDLFDQFNIDLERILGI